MNCGKSVSAIQHSGGNGAANALAGTETYRKFPSAMQALNLVNPVSHTVQQVIEAILLYDFCCCMEQEHGIGCHVVICLNR